MMDSEDNYEKLYDAIKRGASIEEITSLVGNRQMFSVRNWRRPTLWYDRGSALHCASHYNHINLVQELITHYNADVHQRSTWDDETALHCASWRGHTTVVECLLAKGCDINSVNKYGNTALHLASVEGHAKVVQYLLAKGCDINSMNEDDDKALHFASWGGHTTVVECLLAKGCDINCVNKYGDTALHCASAEGHAKVVQYLLAKGCDINSMNEVGQTPLHKAVCLDNRETGRILVMKALLKAGADPTAKDHDGKTPARIAKIYAVKRLLQAAEADHNLGHLMKGKPKVVRLAVLGDEAVGKTQFVENVTSYAITVFFRSFWDPPAKGSDEYVAQRTPGVKIMEIKLSDGRIVRVLDMGGQPQFIASHRPIVTTGFSMYMLMLNLLDGVEKMLISGRYWIQFVIAARHPAMFEGCEPPPLFVLFSHPDLLSSGNPQHLANKVYAHLQDEFSKHFLWMPSNPYIANCRVRSLEIKRLLSSLADAHDEVTKLMPLEPKINNRIRKALKLRNESGGPASTILKLEDFYQFLHQHMSEVIDHKDLASLTTLLDMQADVMLFDAQEVGQDVKSSYVVVDPYHVCHHMLKAILSPHHFKGNHLVFPPHGVIEGHKLDKALEDAGVDPMAGKGLLHYSQICTPNPQPPDSHFFAIHVAATSGTWEDDKLTKVQSGLQVHCLEIPVSPAFLPTLLLALCNATGGISDKSNIWKTGVVVPWENKVMVMVQQAEGGFDINLTARAEPDHVIDCAVALRGVYNITLHTARSFSPGSETVLRYLSPSQVSADKHLTAVYTTEDVIRCYNERRMLTHGQVTDDPDKVMMVLRVLQPHLCLSEEGLTRPACELHPQEQRESAHEGWQAEDGGAAAEGEDGHAAADAKDGGAAPKYSSGQVLKADDPELFDIADALAFDEHHLKRFAAVLLQGSGCRLSASAFLAGLDSRLHSTVPSRGQALIQYWIKSAPPPSCRRFGGQLKAALQRVERSAIAADFCDYLGC